MCTRTYEIFVLEYIKNQKIQFQITVYNNSVFRLLRYSHIIQIYICICTYQHICLGFIIYKNKMKIFIATIKLNSY